MVYTLIIEMREEYKMSLLLMSQASRMRRSNQTTQKEYQDLGTCKNCKYQGNCPFGSQCSRSCFSNKQKSVDKFKLK